MAYTRKNKLLTMQKVLELYLKYKQDGTSTAYVYRTYIYPVYPISIATLYNYLATPVTKELKELDSKGPEQLKLF